MAGKSRPSIEKQMAPISSMNKSNFGTATVMATVNKNKIKVKLNRSMFRKL